MTFVLWLLYHGLAAHLHQPERRSVYGVLLIISYWFLKDLQFAINCLLNAKRHLFVVITS